MGLKGRQIADFQLKIRDPWRYKVWSCIRACTVPITKTIFDFPITSFFKSVIRKRCAIRFGLRSFHTVDGLRIDGLTDYYNPLPSPPIR